jgi:hypothetical protein
VGTQDLVGQTLGDLELLEALGDDLYRARDARHGREVAARVWSGPPPVDAERLFHPNIGASYGARDAGGRTLLLRELVDGAPLPSLGPLAPAELDRVARGLARALAHAHALGITHGDVRPVNVVVTDAGEPRLIDFGLKPARGPADDVRGFGQTLASISKDPPRRIRALIEACLDDDPARRPPSGAALLEILDGHRAARSPAVPAAAWLALAVGLASLGAFALLEDDRPLRLRDPAAFAARLDDAERAAEPAAAFAALLAGDPDAVEPRLRAAARATRDGDHAAALALLREAVALGAEGDAVDATLAAALLGSGAIDKATSTAERAARRWPDSLVARDVLLRVRYAQGDVRAIRELGRAYVGDPRPRVAASFDAWLAEAAERGRNLDWLDIADAHAAVLEETGRKDELARLDAGRARALAKNVKPAASFAPLVSLGEDTPALRALIDVLLDDGDVAARALELADDGARHPLVLITAAALEPDLAARALNALADSDDDLARYVRLEAARLREDARAPVDLFERWAPGTPEAHLDFARSTTSYALRLLAARRVGDRALPDARRLVDEHPSPAARALAADPRATLQPARALPGLDDAYARAAAGQRHRLAKAARLEDRVRLGFHAQVLRWLLRRPLDPNPLRALLAEPAMSRDDRNRLTAELVVVENLAAPSDASLRRLALAREQGRVTPRTAALARARAQMKLRRPQRALDALSAVQGPADLRAPGATAAAFATRLLRAEAYLQSGQPADAARQYRAIVKDAAACTDDELPANIACRPLLARALAQLGEDDALRALWPEADPRVKQAMYR